MRFALVDGQRREPESGLVGECTGCGSPVLARCGDVRVWHWAHKGRRRCHPWWENETEWHRRWKGHFPEDWQEVTHWDAGGERHIADVKTAHGWVLEFQHSLITPQERRSREAFYNKLVWVVDGTRRSRDEAAIMKLFQAGRAIDRHNLRVCRKEGALLRDWQGSDAHVFFEFGHGEHLWWLPPDSRPGAVYIQPIPRTRFLEIHRQTDPYRALDFELMAANLSQRVAKNDGIKWTPLNRL